MVPRERQHRATAAIVIAAVALVLLTTACTCCWVPGAVRRAGSFGRAMPWSGWHLWPFGQVGAGPAIGLQPQAAGARPMAAHLPLPIGAPPHHP